MHAGKKTVGKCVYEVGRDPVAGVVRRKKWLRNGELSRGATARQP